MTFIAYPQKNWELFDYILGNTEMSIATDRYYYLFDINKNNPIKVALMDNETNYWTKWSNFPGYLISNGSLEIAVDVHRSILKNEIVVESDYPTYEENYEAAKIIGNIIEKKGFNPLYYYSGNKSVHMHIFIDWNFLNIIYWDYKNNDAKEISSLINYNLEEFKNEFIKWIRTKMISCWDTNIRKFDSDLINATHLIRCELSKNKIGYKTFLGYSYKDMSFIPYVCNEKNRIYPVLGKIKLSVPNNPKEIVEEFLEYRNKKEIKNKKIRELGNINKIKYSNKIRKSVTSILSNDFKKIGDGYKRALFILISELRSVFGDNEARIIINDWNMRMGCPIKDSDIEYRFNKESYFLSNKYINDFLKEIGYN